MARTGMSDILTELRILSEAGTADYSLAGDTYWSDNQLQNILDQYRTDVVYEQLTSYPVTVAGGSLSWLDYRSSYDWLEATTGGTAILYIQDGAGTTIGTSTYTPDYIRGQFQFGSDQQGSTYYLTARSYDLSSAAAAVWRRKAAHYAPTSFDFSTDNHSIKRSMVYQHCLEMAEYFEGKGAESIQSITMFRSDLNE